ncbi:SpoIIE family protein phosphatase [Arenimonas fontis]|uniref:SpoIIE family protein phosphatase n=1 Tax=Arenimonas fontis TaxID=2608255 RepID=A0A5B2Z8Q7_9GAMM|nr:SpoIIE family protein phosphatase [Arenimonas fontis]KAA2285088.1 SpoIIE family protein phosphatase [Arenimonas fontis]
MDVVADAATAKPARRPLPWQRSLRTRLALWSSLASVLLLLAVAMVFYAALRLVLVQLARDELRNLSEQSARGLQATLDSVQVSGRALTGAAARLGRQPVNLTNLMKATLDADPAIAGVMLIIEPGRLEPGDPGFDWYIRRDGDGLVESSVRALGPEYEDYRVMPWWIRTMTSPDPWWSEPYRNEATANEWFVTYNLALRRSGDPATAEPVGMVSVDVPVWRLRAVLGDAPADGELRPALVTPGGTLAVHADPALAMQAGLQEQVRHGRTELEPLLRAWREGIALELRHELASGPHAGEVRYTVAQPVGDTGWVFGLSVDERWVLASLNRVTFWGVLAGLVGVLLTVLVVQRYSRLIAQPIEDLTRSADHFAQGEFDYPLRHVEREDEVGVMARALDVARDSIKRQMAEIADMGAQRLRMQSELDIARDIQLAMLPRGNELRAGDAHLEVHGLLEPARVVGGDFYNFFQRDDDALWFVIGDVSDKGVPAALFMARALTVLEVAAQLGGSPDRALREAARHLVEGNDTCMFATVLCGVVELRTGMVSLASAAHEPPVLLHADGRRALVPVATEGPLGVDVPAGFPVWRGRLLPGDTLLAYTDGITEAFDPEDRAFGSDRLLAALDPDRNARDQCEALVAAVRGFAGGAPQSDDITVLAVRFKRDADRQQRFCVKAALRPPLPGDPVRQLLAEMDSGLAGHALPMTVLHDLHLVIEEVACNIVHHGAEEGREPALELRATVDQDRLELEFRDDGRPFDPLSAPVPDLDADISDRPIGGLGVHLVRELAEELEYRREAGRNVLRIALHIPPPPDQE